MFSSPVTGHNVLAHRCIFMLQVKLNSPAGINNVALALIENA